MNRQCIRVGFIVLALLYTRVAMAQDPKAHLPMIAAASVPLYPPLARVAHVQGIVYVKITTDGHRVISTHVKDGHKLLAAAAEENARTWQFATHTPTTFTVTYHYKLDAKLEGDRDNPRVVLRFPCEVEVTSVPWPPIDTRNTSR